MEAVIQLFDSPQFGSVRAKMIGDVPYFAGIDVAAILGYTDRNQAVRMHVDEDDKMLIQLSDFQDPVKTVAPHMKGSKIVVINESGVYSLIFGSELESARVFRDWVCDEVLPAIRRTGGYIATKVDDTAESIMARAVLIANDTMARQKAQLEDQAPKNSVWCQDWIEIISNKSV